MTIRLRAHHLLCLLTFVGKGYTPAFVAGYKAVVDRLNAGDGIDLVTGPDDICTPMLDEPACHCHNESVLDRDRQAARDIGVLLTGRPLEPGSFGLTGPDTERLRSGFRNGTLRTACAGCEWQELCTAIAKNNFRGCRLRPPL